MVSAMAPEVIEMQHAVENAGKLFHTVSAPSELSGLITAKDEILAFSEGLLPDHTSALELLAAGRGVFVQPIEGGLAAGFERIDINHASAGLLLIPGRLVEELVQLPVDCTIPSALTRIALQAGVAMRELPVEARSGRRWQMISSEMDAYALEQDWLAEQLGNQSGSSPGRWAARQAVLAVGASMLHAGNASMVALVVTAVVLLIGVGFAWLGLSALGLLLCGAAWVIHGAAILFHRLETPISSQSIIPLKYSLSAWCLDFVLVVLMIWSSERMAGANWLDLAFAPTIFVLLLHVLPKIPGFPGAALLSDRLMICLVLAMLAALGVMQGGVMILVLVLVLAAIAVMRASSG